MTKERWLYLNTGVNNGSFNMSCDEHILNEYETRNIQYPLLRVYAWDKETLSIGSNQNALSGNTQYVRRISGGQSVLHKTSADELTYSVFLFFRMGAKKVYHFIGQALINFLSAHGLYGNFGYDAGNYHLKFDCFESKTPADIVVNDLKIIGSAQYSRRKCIMQHGTIRLDLIRDLSMRNVTYESAHNELKTAFQNTYNIMFDDFSLSNYDYEKIKQWELDGNNNQRKKEIFV